MNVRSSRALVPSNGLAKLSSTILRAPGSM
jgi:hypothetical protein